MGSAITKLGQGRESAEAGADNKNLKIKQEDDEPSVSESMAHVPATANTTDDVGSDEDIKVKQEDDLSDGKSTTHEPATTNTPDATVTDEVEATSEDHSLYVDTRLSYRQGSPLLPVYPVRTSYENVPKALDIKKDTTHLQNFCDILFEHKVSVLKLDIAHRVNKGTPIGKTTLTLCVQSEVSCSKKWESAIRALHAYISEHDLTLAIEIIDHRIFNGRFTIPILSYDPINAFLQKRKHGIVTILNDSGEEWTSLEFFYRGFGPTRKDCKATVLIGVPGPNKAVWWEDVLPKVQEKVGAKADVELCWRCAVKF
ncbi:hypothetical protein N0V83_006103 [Neocucurbitaria cava]|uniref:Uncharacterized protein n=1 Tax=Neocucurbitaria cava TaxID=798079 RepID=A0A9W8Y867_9PLEO|nr:hypothetical protein N0V83_006103 [Neocucurbitaria cava]